MRHHQSSTFYFTFTSLCLTGFLLGCQPNAEDVGESKISEAPNPAEEQTDPVPAPPGQTENPEPAVSVEVLEWDKIKTLIEQPTGKIKVVDLWATYCPPCVTEFPNLVEIHQQHGDEVTCISVSLDYDGLDDTPIAEYQAKVLKFLRKQNAQFQNFLCATEPEVLYNEKLEHSSIPVVFVYDQEGKLVGQFPDPKNPAEFTYESDVMPLVEKLISSE